MLSGPPPASPYASSAPLDITDTLTGLVAPLLGGPGGIDFACEVLHWLQVWVLNCDQRGHKTWHAPRPQQATDGRVLAVLPCWSGRTSWLSAVELILDTEHGEQVRRRHDVARCRIVDFARVCAGFAESTTGRHMTAALSKIADRAGLSIDQAKRARRVLTALDLQVQVSAGRHLSGIEIMAAHSHHGGHQHAVASEYALTMTAATVALIATTAATHPVEPTALSSSTQAVDGAVGSAPLSPFGDRSISSLDVSDSLKSTRPKNRTHTQPRRQPSRSQPRSLALQRLAGGLVKRLRGIDRPGQHLGRICDVLTSCGVDPEKWSAIDVQAMVERDAHIAGLSWPDTVDDPPAYLAWRLRRIDWTQPTPTDISRDTAAVSRPRVVINDCAPTAHATPATATSATTAAARAAIADILSRTTTPPTSTTARLQKEKPAMTSTTTAPAVTVTVYSSPGCGQCVATARHLDKLGVRYDVINLAETPAALDYVRALGYHQAPVVVVGNEHWSGFRPDQLRRALRTAGMTR